MKTRTKRILLTLAGFLLVAICGIMWISHNEAVTYTREWGRLAPFPSSAQGVTFSSTGNMFTRGFRSSFTAPPADIERWLQESPGTRTTQPSSPSPRVRHFQIEPGGGAQGAQVTVDDAQHFVSIYVYWS